MLTTDAKRMLYVLYQEYLKRRKSGLSKSQAKYFQNAQHVHDTFFPDQLLEAGMITWITYTLTIRFMSSICLIWLS